ncbi:MAG: HAMP domain-containing protein, partial [Armatimonadetes bacterium]|nr:HAMP domain-containing protein [Armatimonadota bacterium]
MDKRRRSLLEQETTVKTGGIMVELPAKMGNTVKCRAVDASGSRERALSMLRFKPRSIRAKLVLAMFVAVLPTVAVLAWDEFAREPRAGEENNQVLTFALFFGASLFAVGVVWFLGNNLSRPIRRLSHVADAMAVGDYRRRVAIETGDEFEVLAESLNGLGRSLVRHETAVRCQTEMLAAMAEAARMASSTIHLGECARIVAKVMCSHLGAKDATVYRVLVGQGDVKPIGRCGRRARSVWRLIARRVVESGEQLAISARSLAQQGVDASGEAVLVGLPLSSGEETIGAIVAYFEGVKRSELLPGSVRADVLRTFAVHAAAAITNAEIHTQSEEYSEVLEEWVDHLSVVMQVADAISPSLTLDETLEALAKATAAALGANLCCIFRPNSCGELVLRGCSEACDQAHPDLQVKSDLSEVSRSFVEKRTVLCRDMRRSRFLTTRRIAEETGLRSMVSTPLIVEVLAIGAIALYSAR